METGKTHKIMGIPMNLLSAHQKRGCVSYIIQKNILEDLNMVILTLEYWQDEEWYVGRLVEVPGVFSQGETLAGNQILLFAR